MPLFYSMRSKDNKVVKYKRPFHVSIGFVIVGVMLFYLVYHMYVYLTNEIINIYEVNIGTISSNREYNALALREEQVVTASSTGTVVYIAENIGKVSVKSDVYAIDETGSIVKNMKVTSLSDDSIDERELKKLQSSVNSFTLDYSKDNFNRVYSFKSDLTSQIDQLYSLSALEYLSSDISTARTRGTFHVYRASEPGVCVFSVDGYEGLTLDTLTPESFDSSKLSVTNLKSKDTVDAGQPVYKLITSDKWNLIMQIDKDLANSLRDSSYLQIQFLDDNIKTWTEVEVMDMWGNSYLVLTIDDSMERYADSRFIHVKLLDSNSTGLKIPNSAITTKEFFCIPKEYFYTNGGDDRTLMVKTPEGGEAVANPIIFYETENAYYIDDTAVSEGTQLIRGQSNTLYIVGTDKDSLQGVYNVNKGYAVFKIINIIYQNADYTIVESGTNYGIALYDHIALQGDNVKENDLV